jgi:hypothetical protein
MNLADTIHQLNHHKQHVPQLQISVLEDVMGRLTTLCDSYHVMEQELPAELREGYDKIMQLLKKLKG